MKVMRFVIVLLLGLLLCLGIFACGDIGGGGAGDGDNDDTGDTGGEGTPGITVSKTSVSVSEDLTTDTFTIAPDTQPADGEVIVITVISGDTGEATVNPALLTFTNSSWSARTVTVTGVDDALLDGSITFDITLAIVTASTTANDYDSVTIPAVSCTNTDNDSAAAGIDLVVAIDSVTADGSSVTFSYTASNLGDTDATVDSWIDLFINSASAPVIGNWGDCYVQLLAAELTAGASVSGEKACPSTATSGTAYAIIDTDGSEAESNEDNNITSGFAWPSGIDLVVQIDGVEADGSSVTFSYTASNPGDTDATVGTWIDLFINSTSAPSIGDWGDCGVQLPAADLTAGASVSGTKACTSAATSGTAYAIIDTDGLEAESNENNNITSGLAWTSGGGGSNTAPVANAGPDQKAETGREVILDGSGSSDSDGDDLTYSWSFTSNPGSATLSYTTIVSPTFTPSVDGSYVLELVVNDGTVDSDPDTVTITAGKYLGTACSGDDSCASDGTCFTELNTGLPGGMCSYDCSADVSVCPAGSECIFNLCLPNCASNTNCRSGYSCSDSDMYGTVSPICSSDCDSDSQCPSVGTCNEYNGYCGSSLGKALDGAPCTGNTDCEGGICLTEVSSGLPGGYCTSLCSLEKGICPGDGACLDLFGSSLTGACLDGCTGVGDCRPGYACQFIGSSNVCYAP